MKQLFLLTLIFATFTAAAQPLTLEECMAYAVEHSPQTNAQAARNRIANQNYIEAAAALLPSVSARTAAEFNFGRSLGEDNVYADVSSFTNSYGLSSSLTVFAGLRQINNLRLARIGRLAGRHELDLRRDEVAARTMERFFNVLYLQKMVVLAASQLDESRLNLRQTERMEELGVKGFPDVAEMRAQEANRGYELTRQRNLLTIGVIMLKEAMNFPIDEPLEVAPPDIDIEPVHAPETAAEIYARALDRLPAAAVARGNAEAARIALQVARGARFPTLVADAGYGTSFFRQLGGGDYRPFAEQFRGKRSYYVGLALSVPLFNGLSTQTSIRRSRHQLDIARIERDEALRALHTEIEQAVADMNGAADQYTHAVSAREAAAVAHDLNQRKYDEGLVSALELHTSANRLTDARATELNCRLQYIFHRRMVDYYSGKTEKLWIGF